jgi:hypothetical protein
MGNEASRDFEIEKIKMIKLPVKFLYYESKYN